MLLVFLTFFCLAFRASSLETDTLRQGDFLNSSSQLVSANKLFSLGFYSPDPQNTSILYLAIWCKKYKEPNYTLYSSQEFPVWIGNRNTPIQNNSLVISLDSFGNLFIISNDTTDTFMLYESGRQNSINATATLLDTGNFVVRETISSNGSTGQILWQSFDYPADTLLPGMKLGVNHKTGLNWTLTSWFSDIKPRNGAFTLEWDTKNLQLVIRIRGVISWASGGLEDYDLDGIKCKSFSYFFPNKDFYNYQFFSVKNEDEEYFHYTLMNTTNIGPRNIISGWMLNSEGTFSDPNINIPPIAELDFCYGIKDDPKPNTSPECQTWPQPTCRNKYQKFEFVSGWFYSKNYAASSEIYSNYSERDCRDLCWRNCNCVGYNYSDYDVTGCQIWTKPNFEFKQDYKGLNDRRYIPISDTPEVPDSPIAPNPSNAQHAQHAPKKKSNAWEVGVIITAVVASLVTIVFCLLCYMRRKKVQGKENELLELMALEEYTETIVLDKDGKKVQDLNFFSYASIISATNSFSPENKLGEGGFGPVYKGNLNDGREVAVKRLSRRSGQGLLEFKNELILIAKLQHTNLVRVLGCCMHEEEKMLIYEYMPNKSLDFFIFDQKNRSIVDWPKRQNIIEGVAQGLLYLHKYSRMRVIHRDLKASNVLLDKNMNPKISDFGLARIFKENETEAITNRVVGTYGYMSPEYAMDGTFSEKSDVFSFGILTLEIVSGRRNSSFYNLDTTINLVGYAWDLWKEGAALELKDPTLGHSFAENQLLRTVHVALLCVQDRAIDRPTMSDVISMLSNETSTLPNPKQPAFFASRTAHLTTSSEVTVKDNSVNEASITAMEPR